MDTLGAGLEFKVRIEVCCERFTFGHDLYYDCLNIMQGADIFKAKVNIEVQMASELAIAAIEKNGGVVTTAFYDPRSLGKHIVKLFSCCPFCLVLPAALECLVNE